MKDNKVYIYDYNKAYFYIQNGVLPIDPPKEHNQTHKVFFTFDYEDTKDLYNEWINRKYK